MIKDKDFKYRRCQNCGKYFTSEQTEENKFCSEECKIYYISCVSCGNYFTGLRSNKNIYCSPNCGINPESQDSPALRADIQ